MKRDKISVGSNWRFGLFRVFVLIVSSFALSVAANAQTTYQFSNPNPINIPGTGTGPAPGAPYPSTINVTGVTSVISKVTLKLNNLSHTFPSDIDILLVGPGGQNAIIMSDVGGGDDINAITLTLDDAAANPMPANLLTSGTYRPTNITAGDTFPAPAPAPSGGSPLSVFNGTLANGTWSLYVYDDAGIDIGSMAGGWNLSITNSVSGENTTAIAFPDSGTASPYPSAIDISGFSGKVTSVVVNVGNFSHTTPDDVDLMLVSPTGRSVVLMSDVGGGNPVSNLALTFDDTAANSLPDASTLTSGTFKPTDFETGDTFPAPAPAGAPTGSKLGAFFNDEPNGAWKLFAVDDSGSNTGSIAGGWSIIINSSTTAIGIPASGVAEPYPSEITVSGQTGLVSKVTVSLTNFNHTLPDDVDLMLVAPNGRKVVLMSDVGGNTAANNLSLTFDDAATGSMPDNAPLSTGSYKPTDFEPGDIFPSTPGGAVTGAMLSAFNGSDPNGAWQLYLVDDNGNNAGTINAWNLSLQTSDTAINIPAVGLAEPYPSNFQVSSLQGNVTKVVAKLTNFSHTSPDDVDILLVAPNGRRIVLMSDVGGNTEVGGLNLTFDDTAASNLPDNAPLTSGTFKPTDFEAGDSFPMPAPQGALTGTTLNAFYGSAPNGLWKLFVVDDNGNNLGSIAGSWSLVVESSPTACLFTLSPTVQAFPITGGSGSFSINMPSGCSWSASTTAGFITINSNSSGDGNGSIAFSVAPNMEGGRGGTIDVTNGVVSRSFQAQQPSGCPFSVNQSVMNFGGSGGSGNVSVTAGGVCSWQASSNASWIHVTSAQQTGDGTASFTVSPNTSPNPRNATVTIGARTVTVNQLGAGARRFDFDGDGKSDVSVYRPSSGIWYLLNSAQSGSYSAVQFGLSSDKIAPADFDGDRKTDVAVFRPSEGRWYIFQSQTNTVRIESWGLANDTPVPADYDGDGRADVAVRRPSDGTWYFRRSSDNAYFTVTFGGPSDKPIPGNFGGDGRADFALYRAGATAGSPSSWIIANNDTVISGGTQQFGVNGDIALAADFDGDGVDNIAVYRPSNGTWYTSLDPNTNYGAKQWGINGDIPAAGDYNGDGRADYAVYRQGVWYIQHSNDNSIRTENWGIDTDTVVPNAFSAQ